MKLARLAGVVLLSIIMVSSIACSQSTPTSIIPAMYGLPPMYGPNTVNLSINLAKYEYDPGEQISIVTELKNDITPLTEASVTAAIKRPDETVASLALYDDGLHGDGKAEDGIYANTYDNTETWGMYTITVSANGMVNGEKFATWNIVAVWAQRYPDLTLTSSNISFSNNTPVAGETITISAIISNIGGANSGNAAVFFYDGPPGSGVEIGEAAINIDAGRIDTASISWRATADEHEIHVVISPYDGDLQSDYTNDEGYKIINVLH